MSQYVAPRVAIATAPDARCEIRLLTTALDAVIPAKIANPLVFMPRL